MTLLEIGRDDFAFGINYHNNSYTPKQVLDYIQNEWEKSLKQFANPQESEELKRNSLTKAKELIDRYKLPHEQPLTKTSSDSGRKLAELVLQHCDSTIALIVDGGLERGYLI